jgi:hypothetical protein
LRCTVAPRDSSRENTMLEPLAKLECRSMRKEDMESVVLLDRECYGGGGLWTQKMYEQEMMSERSRVLVLLLGARIVGVGCISYVLDEGSIENIAVSPRERGRGRSYRNVTV